MYHVLKEEFHTSAVVESGKCVGIDLTVLYFEECKMNGKKSTERYDRRKRKHSFKYCRCSRKYDKQQRQTVFLFHFDLSVFETLRE